MKKTSFPSQREDFRKTFSWRIFKIMAEFVDGFHFVADFKKTVGIFGSSRFSPNNPYYQEARKLARLLVKDKFTVFTGAGGGIMEAANRGAFELNGESVGMNVQLPKGQTMNKYVNRPISFYYFFTRKVMLSFGRCGYVFFPGGFGTLDEFFEMVTLVQTKKLPYHIPIIAISKSYWQPLFDWLEKEVYEKQRAISKQDLKSFHLVDSAEQAFRIIKKNYSK
ncbi:MAG: TIGR00730 family Rossman fold protein [Candidatus Nealsonbacteria bacterium]|nr:TIGR00730 family Rossman fold protein [Candidatus Nealsonbacteria bacterium]